MPRPKKVINDELPDLFEIEPDELDKAIADLPSGESYITVYRVRSQGQGHPVFVASYTPEEFSLELIQQNHGGGKYNLWAKRGHEVIRKMRVEIEGEPKNAAPLANAYLRRVNAQGKPVFLNKREIEQEEEQAATLKAVSGGDNALMLILIQKLDSLAQAITGGTTGGGLSRKDFLEEMVQYKQIFSPNPVGDVTTILQKGLEIGARAASGDVGGSNSWLVDAIKELSPVVQQFMTAFNQKTAIEAAARTRATAPAPHATNLPANNTLKRPGIDAILPDMNANQPLQSGFAAIAPMLAAYVPLVLPIAARDGSPDSVIEIIDNNLSEEQRPHVIEWLQSPSWFKDLCTLDPRIQLQAAWWSELHDTLLSVLTGVPLPQPGDGTQPDEDENLN